MFHFKDNFVEVIWSMEAEAEALIRFSWKQLLLPASASMQVFWGFVQRNGVNFLEIVGKRYFGVGSKSGQKNLTHNVSLQRILLKLSGSMEVEVEADMEVDAEVIFRFFWKWKQKLKQKGTTSISLFLITKLLPQLLPNI